MRTGNWTVVKTWTHTVTAETSLESGGANRLPVKQNKKLRTASISALRQTSFNSDACTNIYSEAHMCRSEERLMDEELPAPLRSPHSPVPLTSETGEGAKVVIRRIWRNHVTFREFF